MLLTEVLKNSNALILQMSSFTDQYVLITIKLSENDDTHQINVIQSIYIYFV